MTNPNLTPEARANKNGVVVTKHVNPNKGQPGSQSPRNAERVSLIPPPRPGNSMSDNTIRANDDGTFTVQFSSGSEDISIKDMAFLSQAVAGHSDTFAERRAWKSSYGDLSADPERNIIGTSFDNRDGTISIEFRNPEPHSHEIDAIDSGFLMFAIMRHRPAFESELPRNDHY